MSGLSTKALQQAFVDAFSGKCQPESPVKLKPLLVAMEMPLPPHLRVYAYNLVGGIETVRPFEYKAVLRVPNHPVGEYRSFDHSGGRMALLIAFREDLDVWVMWDASLHPRFKNGGNIQIRTDTVMTAAATGMATQERKLGSGQIETVFACTTRRLPETLLRRLDATGGTIGDAIPS